MEILKRRLFSKIIILMTLAVLPGFSLYASAAEVSQPAATNTFVFQLKDGNAGIFKDDANVKNVEHVFINSSYTPFKNTYSANTLYSQAEFEKKYGYDFIYIHPEHIYKTNDLVITPQATVNDPGFSSDPNNVDRQWALYKARFTDAWNRANNANNVVIAEIDTGIDGTHEDLSSGQIVPGYNIITRTIISSNEDSDDNGHGTLVAGVIAATQNNFRGIAGAAPNSLLMPLKALDANGSGNSADIAAAIVYAADHGASVINLSLGGFGFANDTTLSDAVKYAFNKGAVIVAAAGNDTSITGNNLDNNPVFPICNDNGSNMVIGVAATDINDFKATFSNYGKACVDVSAPGKRILSTINHDPGTHLVTNDAYAYASGTSLAAPFVSAEAALIKATFPNLTNAQIRDRIIKTTDPIDSINTTNCNSQSCNGLIGSGRINAANALDPSIITITSVIEGDLVRDETGAVYYIAGGQKQPVSNFVFNQKFAYSNIKTVQASDIANYPLGPYAIPYENTVVKSANSPVVYQMVNGIKRPMTWQVFIQRGITQIAVLSDVELASWVTGKFLPPLEGTIVKGKNSPALYWVLDQQFHIMNYPFYVQRGLTKRPVMIVPDSDLQSYPLGNAFIY